MAPHILSSFDDALNDLSAKVLAIATQTTRNLDHCFVGIFTGEEALCLRTIADDEIINSREREIDAAGIAIMTRYQPMARDLRQVLTSMRVANNIERVSDEAKNIARRARQIITSNFTDGNALIKELSDLALSEYHDAFQSFVKPDLELANTIAPRDKDLDARYRKAVEDISNKIAEVGGPDTPHYLNVLFIIRSIERIGDHAKNIAEETMFMMMA